VEDGAVRNPDATSRAADELSRLLGPLRRRVLRRSRDLAGLPDLPEAQVEVLRTLTAQGPQSPSGLAQALRLARPTISNLLRAMTAAGLVSRTPDPSDLRVVDVRATPEALSLLRRYDAASEATLAAAVERLDPRDQQALPGAVEVLGRLLAALEQDPDDAGRAG
jgi:DNA-binding MarR family transcriptional regulator